MRDPLRDPILGEDRKLHSGGFRLQALVRRPRCSRGHEDNDRVGRGIREVAVERRPCGLLQRADIAQYDDPAVGHHRGGAEE
jgi:hypothetical protein